MNCRLDKKKLSAPDGVAASPTQGATTDEATSETVKASPESIEREKVTRHTTTGRILLSYFLQYFDFVEIH